MQKTPQQVREPTYELRTNLVAVFFNCTPQLPHSSVSLQFRAENVRPQHSNWNQFRRWYSSDDHFPFSVSAQILRLDLINLISLVRLNGEWCLNSKGWSPRLRQSVETDPRISSRSWTVTVNILMVSILSQYYRRLYTNGSTLTAVSKLIHLASMPSSSLISDFVY